MGQFRLPILCALLVVLLAACSASAPREYGVTQIQDQARHYYNWAEQLRLQTAYTEADKKYKKAYALFAARNDVKWMINSVLKRALMAIQRQDLPLAEQLLSQATKMAEYESASSLQAVKFVAAQLAHAQGDNEQAVQLLGQITLSHQADSEPYWYYLTQQWKIAPESVASADIARGVDWLVERYKLKQLEQIEILMFTLNTYCQFMIEQKQDSDKLADYLSRLIAIYANYEMTSKLQLTFAMTARYYQQIGDNQKAAYYRQKIVMMTSEL
ncbi:hypothetical protein C2869_16925 [Saccharobesus litoralis]|uniref:Uncharacterized protein n=1 Tax=Saccharobesus litoralis TaxID=2172099 RepID=A0A2S0VUZ6_9ALTE|nr:hypothetical protein [Saccharobesus litoralis]AWB68003.1 hypothetical protein C2869_16925 [Saccharobesus litoralis]